MKPGISTPLLFNKSPRFSSLFPRLADRSSMAKSNSCRDILGLWKVSLVVPRCTLQALCEGEMGFLWNETDPLISYIKDSRLQDTVELKIRS